MRIAVGGCQAVGLRMVDVQALVIAVGRLQRSIERVGAGCALGDVRGSCCGQRHIGVPRVARDGSHLRAALRDIVALADVCTAVAGWRRHRAAVDVDTIADQRIGGVDDIYSRSSVQRASAQTHRSRVIDGGGGIVGRDSGILLAGCSDLVHLVVTKRAGLALLLFVLV